MSNENPKQQRLSSLRSAPKSMRNHPDIDAFYQDFMDYAEDNETVTKADKLAAAMCAQVYAIYKSAERELYNEDINEFEPIIE